MPGQHWPPCYRAWVDLMIEVWPPESTSLRIHRRLRSQHSRWLLRQPISDGYWFQLRRRFFRKTRQIRIECYKLIQRLRIEKQLLAVVVAAAALAMIVLVGIAILFLFVLPSQALLLRPERTTFQGIEQQAAVALTRFAICSTVGIGILWCLLPGTARISKTDSRLLKRKRYSFIGIPRRDRDLFMPRNYRWFCIGATAIATVALLGILVCTQSTTISIVCAVLFTGSVGWFVYRVGLRLMRYRAPVFWVHTLPEIGWFSGVFLGAWLIIPMVSRGMIAVCEWLTLIGPIGFVLSALQQISQGAMAPLTVVVAASALAIGAGWIVARDAGAWRNRRRLLEAQRLPRENPSSVSEATHATPAREDLICRIRRDFNHTIVSRRHQQWRTWLYPDWFGRKLWFCISVGVLIVSTQAFIAILNRYVQSAGPMTDRFDFDRTNHLLSVFVPLTMVMTEALFFSNRLNSCVVTHRDRPLPPVSRWLELQRDGLVRIPLLVLFATPVAAVSVYGGVSVSGIVAAMCTALVMLFSARNVVATFELVQAYESILRVWVHAIVYLISLALGMFVFMGSVVASRMPLDWTAISASAFAMTLILWATALGLISESPIRTSLV